MRNYSKVRKVKRRNELINLLKSLQGENTYSKGSDNPEKSLCNIKQASEKL